MFDIGRSVQMCLKQKSISVAQMARDLGITYGQANRLKSQKDCKLGRVYQLAEYFGMDFQSFVALGNTPEYAFEKWVSNVMAGEAEAAKLQA